MTRLEALKQGFSLDERTLLHLRMQFMDAIARHCPDQPEAFGDGMELRYRLIMVVSADSVDFERSVREYNEFVDRINDKYGPATATRYRSSGKWGLTTDPT